MKAPPFSYHAPRSLHEALELLARLENAKVLAGGQSLVPMLNYRLAMPDHVIDLAHVGELRGITLADSGLRIGAMTTQRQIEKSEHVAARCPLLLEALGHVGHQTTRNRGTIGGSLCHLDPSAELPLVAQVLEPRLTIASLKGPREMAFAEFPVNYLTPRLEADEILASIEFPPLDPEAGYAFEEFALRPGDFAVVAVAAMVTPGKDGLAKDVRIAAGGLGPVAVRLRDAERVFTKQRCNPELLRAASDAAASYSCEGDRNHPAEYRQHLVKVLTARALTRACRKLEVTHA